MKRESKLPTQTNAILWGLPMGEFVIVALVALTIGIGIGAFALTSPANTSDHGTWSPAVGSTPMNSQVVENLTNESHHSSMRRK